MNIAANVDIVRKNIREAAGRAGRNPDDITLIAVTKNHEEEAMREAVDSGITEIGESKAQEVKRKHSLLDREVNWHFIGHLQRNKVKYVIDKVAMIHSVESVSLAREISKRAEAIGRIVPVLLEVNVSGEKSKKGLNPDQLESFLQEIADLPGIQIRGLMTMAPHADDPETVRPVFRKLRKERDALQEAGWSLDILSMGMTNDYVVAVEEGATHVRVGTAIFGARDYEK